MHYFGYNKYDNTTMTVYSYMFAAFTTSARESCVVAACVHDY